MMARGIDQNNMEIAKTFFGNGDEFRASALVCVNARIKDWVLTRFPVDAHWVRVIPSGPPASAFSAKYPSGDEPFKLVCAGVIREHPKRVSKIFNYFQHALTQFPKLQLTFIGDGPMRPVLEKMTAEAGLVGKVHFTGILLDEQYKKELANHHVLLLFSDNEGTPGCVMDAMSCSVVPLCKRIPGIDFLVNDSKNGLIFDGSKPDFMEKLERIIDPHFWEKASIESKNDFATQFSLDIWLTLIDDLSQKSKLNFPKQAPTNLRLPMLRYHMANADRRKNRFQFLVRGAYIVHQRLTAKLKGFSK
jgi:glycosyltransferase involved in cell wall biosynthesis